MLLSTHLVAYTLLGSALALPGSSKPCTFSSTSASPQTSTTRCTSSSKATSVYTLKLSTKCASALKPTSYVQPANYSTPTSSTKPISSSEVTSTSEITSSFKPTSSLNPSYGPSTSVLASSVKPTSSTQPTPTSPGPMGCKTLNPALDILKGLGPIASPFCSSYLHLPPATSTTITLPVATTTVVPVTIVVTITPTTDVVTITPTTEILTITDATSIVTITPLTDIVTVTPVTETSIIQSTATVTTTAVPVCNKRRSDRFEEGAFVEGNNNVTYTPRDSNLILSRRTGDLGLLQQFATEKVSAGCSCLSLPHETATVTVTPSQEN
ncbi:hypothetical protein E8E11_008918 [Didymella keratinophila]|nr:hypothetical protein E8E11_008918 [Didymella keratinophila]